MQERTARATQEVSRVGVLSPCAACRAAPSGRCRRGARTESAGGPAEMRGKTRASRGGERPVLIGGIESGQGPLILLLQPIAAPLIGALGAVAAVGLSNATAPLPLSRRLAAAVAGSGAASGALDRALLLLSAARNGALKRSRRKEGEAIRRTSESLASEMEDTARTRARRLGLKALLKAAVYANSNLTHPLLRNFKT